MAEQLPGEDYQYRGADRCEQSSAFLNEEWCKTLRCRFEAGFLELKDQRAEEEREEELVKREEGGSGHRGEGKRISEHRRSYPPQGVNRRVCAVSPQHAPNPEGTKLGRSTQ